MRLSSASRRVHGFDPRGSGVCVWPLRRSPANAPVPNPGDTAWMLTSSALVLMMSIPGLALFYGGLVRSKNMASILTQTFTIVALVGVLWTLYGYSLAFGDGGSLNAYIGGFNKVFLKGVGRRRQRRRPSRRATSFRNSPISSSR